MKVTFWGTRGSIPVCHITQVGYGGNTTCLRVESDRIPKGMGLFVDAGSGIRRAGKAFMKEGGKQPVVLNSHDHHDHTQGFLLCPFPFIKPMPVRVYGPEEHGVTPREVYETLMRKPYFPVDLREIGGHIQFFGIKHPNSTIMVFHPEGGIKMLQVEEFDRFERDGQHIPFQKGVKYSISECLVVKMHRNNHPEQTISFRFEERTSGLVFVFVTDHENQDGVPRDFLDHLRGADLLVMDCQYNRKLYDTMTAGWGHSTPDYVARVAQLAGAKVLGLTHHDPDSTDNDVDEIVLTAQYKLEELKHTIPVFGCRDYHAIKVGTSKLYSIE